MALTQQLPAAPTDTVQKRGKSLIQHGKNSDRVYLIKVHQADLPELLHEVAGLVDKHGYSKVFAKIPGDAAEEFLARGYQIEAFIPRFYNQRTAALFFARYPDPARAETGAAAAEIARVVKIARARRQKGLVFLPPAGFTLRTLEVADAEAAAAVYRTVFATYPFPIHDPAYLRQTMASHVVYFGCFHEGRLVAVSSAELDVEGENGEMTDFATLPEFRGRRLACVLLQRMEAEMARRNIRMLYTIARALSPGMNITFALCGYTFAGTLRNNTQIAGAIESMNVWFRRLA
ncbi:MAG: putative beta-lysine N-acetyltransferase [Myxococcota bacterium]|nr:putative beta-lysine N-acetyltransferase [Myxococcota bacterium]